LILELSWREQKCVWGLDPSVDLSMSPSGDYREYWK